jgi:hypothetical protein
MSLGTILLLAAVGLMLLRMLRPGAHGGGCCGGHGGHQAPPEGGNGTR